MSSCIRCLNYGCSPALMRLFVTMLQDHPLIGFNVDSQTQKVDIDMLNILTSKSYSESLTIWLCMDWHDCY